MEQLQHVEDARSHRRHRYPCVFEVPNEEHVGPRGGRKVPIDIYWRQHGTGLLASVSRICGCTLLFPYVRYHNGNGKPRLMFAKDWVGMTGKGLFRDLTEKELEAYNAELVKCDEQKSFYGARTAEIVTSILNNGGTLTIRSTK